jgi:hypothetical protein
MGILGASRKSVDADSGADYFSSCRESLLDQVMRDIPARMLLIPGDGSTSHDLKQLMLIPLRWEDMAPPLRIRIMNCLLGELPGDSRKVAFIRRELENLGLQDQNNGSPVPMPLPELIRDLRESTLNRLYSFIRPRMATQTINILRLFRRCWEIISGGPLSQQHTLSNAEFTSLWKNLRRDSNRNASLGLGAGADELKPGLLLRREARDMLFFRLRRNYTARDFAVPDRQRIGMFHLEEPVPIPNPFYEIALHVLDEANQAVQSFRPFSEKEKEEEEKDHSFLTCLKDRRLLRGSGKYKSFSLSEPCSLSGTFIRLSLDMGEKPFLQQVSQEPLYVYWDLGEHRINIVLQLKLEDGELPLTSVTSFAFFAVSDHPSVCRHAFVRRLEGHETVGTICTEHTNQRILSLHKSSPSFDPVACMLEQMEGAARVLRYGVRERDKGINQHNPFHKVDRGELQAVVEGEEEATKFAMKRGAEIIPYDR